MSDPIYVTRNRTLSYSVNKLDVDDMLSNWTRTRAWLSEVASMMERTQLSFLTPDGVIDAEWFASIAKLDQPPVSEEERYADLFAAVDDVLPSVWPTGEPQTIRFDDNVWIAVRQAGVIYTQTDSFERIGTLHQGDPACGTSEGLVDYKVGQIDIPRAKTPQDAMSKRRAAMISAATTGGYAGLDKQWMRDPQVALIALDANAENLAVCPLKNDAVFLARAIALGIDLDPSYLPIETPNEVYVALLKKWPERWSDIPEGKRLTADVAAIGIEIASAGGWLSRFEVLPLAIQANPKVRAAALKAAAAQIEEQPWAYNWLPQALRADADLAFAAVTHGNTPFGTLRGVVPNSLLVSFMWTTRVLKKNPLKLGALLYAVKGDMDLALAWAKEVPALAKEYPVLTDLAELKLREPKKYADLKNAVGKLELYMWSRFPDGKSLMRAVEDRTPRAGDERPVALIVICRDDPNSALHKQGALARALNKEYRVVYVEVETVADIAAAVKLAGSQQPIQQWWVEAHGTEDAIYLGGELLDKDAFVELAELKQYIAPGATIILDSCSTGRGNEQRTNPANVFAMAFPQADIYAPTAPSTAKDGFKGFDFQGRPLVLGVSAPYYYVPASE